MYVCVRGSSYRLNKWGFGKNMELEILNKMKFSVFIIII